METHDNSAERDIFAAAAALPPEERAAYLDAACADMPELRVDIEAWLEAHEGCGFMAAEDEPERSRVERAGEHIGSYKLLEKIGEGGFGTVWVADQERPVRRRVALKIVKLGMDTQEVIARFGQERQALALMDHPHIAKVFDAGATESGRPFFVMELVRGVKITEYCDQAKLPTAARLDLFIQVCHAVQHAHQKGIIHRDLKPSNILVALHDGVPVPKVIDFGVAKATQQQLADLTIHTRFQQMVGTPLYMSPEQAEMSGLDVDTRSDIYSLGVLLYELLTGRTPFDPGELMSRGLDEIRRVIREREPRTPSTFLRSMPDATRAGVARHRQADPGRLMKQVRGDLDWIVMKALEKDRKRRYDTANGLAMDIQRHLAREPVLARPPGRLYRFVRTFQRNKLAFASGGVVAAALLLAVVVLAASRTRITNEKNQKDIAFQQRGVALADAEEQLYLALLNQARAGRYSRQMGQRLGGLESLASAARIHQDERLRDEAIAAMALPDIRPGPSWDGARPVGMDGLCQLSVTHDAETLVVHSVPDGREVQRVESGHLSRNVALSRDGRFVLQHDVDFKLRVWRVSDGQPVFDDLSGTFACWDFSPDSRQLAVGSHQEIRLLDLAKGETVARWQARGSVHSLAFHPRDPVLAVGYARSTFVSVINAADGAHLAELESGAVNEHVMAWHPDGSRLAIGGSDPRIQIWNVPARRKVATLEGHAQQVNSLGFHPDGSLLVSNSWEAIHRLWEPSSGRQVMQFQLPLSTCAFSNDGRWLGALQRSAGGQLLRVAGCPEYLTLVSSLGAGQGEFFDGGISPDGRLLAMAMNDGVRLWDLVDGRELALLGIGPTHSAFFQPDGRELLTCGPGGVLRWTVHDRTDATRPLVLGPAREIRLSFVPTRAAGSRDGRHLAVACESPGVAIVVNLADPEGKVLALQHPQAGFVAMSPDGTRLATGGWHSHSLRVWNARTGVMEREWETPSLVGIDFTPDSRALVTVQPAECRIWNLETFQAIRRLPRDASHYPSTVAFTQDERMMALEVSPGVVHLVETTTGRSVAKLTDPFNDRATWMSFTPDGTRLVTASTYAKTVHVWNLRLIRKQLKEMDLDWEWPEFPAEPPS